VGALALQLTLSLSLAARVGGPCGACGSLGRWAPKVWPKAAAWAPPTAQALGQHLVR